MAEASPRYQRSRLGAQGVGHEVRQVVELAVLRGGQLGNELAFLVLVMLERRFVTSKLQAIYQS